MSWQGDLKVETCVYDLPTRSYWSS